MSRLVDHFLTKKVFFRGSSVLALTTILSYALGLFRDRVFATTFGASRALDAYNAAFILPDLILNIFVAGALTAAFIPIFSGLSDEGPGSEANSFINSVINSSLLVVLFCDIIVFIFAPQLSHWIVPGFDAATRTIFINLARLLLLSPLVFSISNTLGNILLTKDKYFWYGSSAALYNLGIIIGTILLVPRFGIYGVGIGTLLGSLLHLLGRIIGLRYRFHWQPRINFNQNYRHFLRLMLPKIIGHPIEQLTFLAFTIIASGIGAGAIAILNFARNFQSMPINTIGVNLALTAFPILSRSVARSDLGTFRSEFSYTAKVILVITSLAAILLYLLRQPIIAIFLGGGAFDINAITITATALGVFALSVPTESLSHLQARGFYALKDSLTPVLVSTATLLVAVSSGYLLAIKYGVPGLALGFFIGSALKSIVLFFLLRRKLAIAYYN